MGRGKKRGKFKKTWEKESLITQNPVVLLSILNGSLSAN
jgi:hypothetical protein